MINFKNIFNNPKRRAIIIGVSVIMIFFAVILFSDYGLLNRFKLEYKKLTLKREIEEKNRISDSLRQEIELLKSDPATIERIAREKYGMKRKNEEVYYLPKEEQ
ncbi:MAG: septum formation initiator family protein [Candidatus Kapabacteria bacterium]|nr:septum formation initiator family protein [Ignavibacteriota bacterium]MCW5883893.1 septum formation initiator family protein [Candidatus Kapabacteria bacterium]